MYARSHTIISEQNGNASQSLIPEKKIKLLIEKPERKENYAR